MPGSRRRAWWIGIHRGGRAWAWPGGTPRGTRQICLGQIGWPRLRERLRGTHATVDAGEAEGSPCHANGRSLPTEYRKCRPFVWPLPHPAFAVPPPHRCGGTAYRGTTLAGYRSAAAKKSAGRRVHRTRGAACVERAAVAGTAARGPAPRPAAAKRGGGRPHAATAHPQRRLSRPPQHMGLWAEGKPAPLTLPYAPSAHGAVVEPTPAAAESATAPLSTWGCERPDGVTGLAKATAPCASGGTAPHSRGWR